MIVIISLFAKNNNIFFNSAARKKRIFPRKKFVQLVRSALILTRTGSFCETNLFYRPYFIRPYAVRTAQVICSLSSFLIVVFPQETPPRRDFEESTALCRLQRRKCYIELLHFCTAATSALRRATAAGSSYRIYDFGRPSADGRPQHPLPIRKEKVLPSGTPPAA